MATLNDTARTILSAAAARKEHRVLPLPELRAPAHIVKKMVARMIMDGLLAEVTALPEDTAWTESNHGGRVALVVTPAGLAAIGVEQEAAPVGAPTELPPPSGTVRGGRSKRTGAKTATTKTPSETAPKQSKQHVVLGLLRRPEGASVAEMVKATGWQPHSVRGFLAGAVKRRLGFGVTSAKGEDGERRYHVTTPAADGGEPA